MKEAELQAAILELCDYLGIHWWHDTDSRKNRGGLPDLILVGNAVLWVELKAEKGRLRPAQAEFIERLQEAGQEVAVWRPSDWTSGRVIPRLKALSPRASRR